MKDVARVVLLVLMLVSAAGCTLKDAVNELFPPLSTDQARNEAIASLMAAVERMESPTIAARANVAELRTALVESEIVSQYGIQEIDIATERQLLRVSATFNHAYTGDEEWVARKPDSAAWIKRLKPQLRGTLTIYFKVTAEIGSDKKKRPSIVVAAVPLIHRVQLDNLILFGEKVPRADFGPAAQLFVGIVNEFKDNISGVLNRNPPLLVTLPMDGGAPDPLQKIVTLKPTEGRGTISVTGNAVPAPLTVNDLVVLVSAGQITLVAQLQPPGTAPAVVPGAKLDFDELAQRVNDIIEDDFGMTDNNEAAWVLVKKAAIAYSLNKSLEQANVCVAVDAVSKKFEVSANLEVPDGSGMKCALKVCNPVDCNIPVPSAGSCSPKCVGPQVRDWRGNKHCVSGVYAPDNACAASLAVAVRKLTIDTQVAIARCTAEAPEKFKLCQSLEAAKFDTCVRAQTTLKAVAKSGDLAKLDLAAQVGAHRASICVKNFNADDNLSHISFSMEIAGEASVDAELRLRPRNSGYLACMKDWKNHQHVVAKLRQADISMSANLGLNSVGNVYKTTITTEPFKLKYAVKPSPTEMLLNSSDMMASCPATALLKDIAVPLKPFVPELQGDFDYSADALSFDINLGIPELQKFGVKIDANVVNTGQAIGARGVVTRATPVSSR